MAFAPSRAFVGVPSSSISVRSIAPGRSRRGRAIASAISPSTCATARATPLPSHASLAVAQLDRLVLARRGAGRDRGAAERARVEADLDLDRRVPARVEDLAAVDVDDLAQGVLVLTDENTRPSPERVARQPTLRRCQANGADT